ncbi:MAG: DUF2971 domain-containing protein [Bacteroidaceae bacterium]|nr:DUF2971 domain-containing protein [Bacteroidaceae bacterium]
MTNFRELFREYIESVKIPSDADSTIVEKGWNSIYKILLPNIPEKLFRYRSVNDYSIDDFKKGEISLCHAGMFPDKYDSCLFVDKKVVKQNIDNGYDSWMLIFLESIRLHPELYPSTEIVARTHEYMKGGYTNEQIRDILKVHIGNTYINDFISYLKNKESRFRSPRNSAKIGCFTESVHSKYMWDRYGGGYKGFALRYDFRNIKEMHSKKTHELELFPVFYSEERLNATYEEMVVFMLDFMKQTGFSSSAIMEYRKHYPVNQLYWFLSYLYKDKKVYEHEQEWRMLYYNLTNEDDYYSISDKDCVKAIYYGPDISNEDRNTLREIAVKRGVEEFNVVFDEDSSKFDLKAIPI